MKYAWIEAQQKRHRFNVDAMCESLNVNRSGYYAHKNEDKHRSALIVKSFNESNHTYGTERIQRDLQELGERVSRCRIGRLMKKQVWFAKPSKNSRQPRIQIIMNAYRLTY